MKKKYILTLEFEAEIIEKVSPKGGRRPQPISRFAAAPKQGIAKKLVFLTNLCRVLIKIRLKKKDRYFNKLFAVLLKNDQSIKEIYRNLLMSDLGNGNHIYEIDKNIRTLKVRDDIEVLNPVIELLPADEKNHFLEILESEDKTTDDFFEGFFDHFGVLKVKDAKFTEKNI